MGGTVVPASTAEPACGHRAHLAGHCRHYTPGFAGMRKYNPDTPERPIVFWDSPAVLKLVSHLGLLDLYRNQNGCPDDAWDYVKPVSQCQPTDAQVIHIVERCVSDTGLQRRPPCDGWRRCRGCRPAARSSTAQRNRKRRHRLRRWRSGRGRRRGRGWCRPDGTGRTRRCRAEPVGRSPPVTASSHGEPD